jgi:ubiquinone/menaquinone biosynthesis C-methylase UbiE
MLRRLIFNIWYLRKPPWDTGISPPELIEFIQNHSPGNALDLGCGTGTNIITLAKAGWNVTGVDFASSAIRSARQKLKQQNLHADLHIGDVTRLNHIKPAFDLVLDIGCFHSLTQTGMRDYLNQLDHILAPNGSWLMYAFFHAGPLLSGPGLAEADIDRIATRFILLSRQNGFDNNQRNSAWFLYQKKAKTHEH